MKIIPELLSTWFGFTRRERRSSVILLCVIFIIFMIRYLYPENSIDIIDVTGRVIAEAGIGAGDYRVSEEHALFPFNPNNISFDSLLLLGLTEKEAATLMNYRNKGGKFVHPSDLKKIYGLDSAKAASLVSFVRIAANSRGGDMSWQDDTVRKKVRRNRPAARELVDLNRCDSAQLVKLPGIGAVLAGRIIRYRGFLGGFSGVGQLKEVYGLREETYNIISGMVSADSSMIEKVNVNNAGYQELSGLPYVSRYEIAALIKYRQINGSIRGIAELIENKIISSEKAGKLAPYVFFGKIGSVSERQDEDVKKVP